MKEIATQEILESFKSLFQSASEKQIRDFSDSFSVEPKLAYGIDKSVLQQHKDPNSVSNAQQDQNFYVVFMKESRLSSTSEFVADYYQ
jgi:predicted ATP-binding protein involved in virulence